MPRNLATGRYETVTESPTRKFVRIDQDGTVQIDGIQHGPLTVRSLSDQGFVLHEAGHSYWSGRGDQGYAPAEITAYVWEGEPGQSLAEVSGWAIPVTTDAVRTKPNEIAERMLNRKEN